MATKGYMLVRMKGKMRGRPVPGWPVFRDRPAAVEQARRMNPDPNVFSEVGVKEVQVAGK